MTSRTTPVGILVIALAGLIVVGCSAPTNALFQALLDPDGTAVSSPEVDPADSAAAGSGSSTWWQHPDGYEMVLPPGWNYLAVAPDQTDEIVDAIDATNPGLAVRIESVVGNTDLRVSAIAVSGVIDGQVGPLLVVLAEPKSGRKWYAIKEDTKARIGDLPGLRGGITPHQYQLPSAEGVRYDFTIEDEDLGEVRIRSWLFKWANSAYLVNFVVSAELVNDAGADFDSIQDSLQFGT